MHNVFAYRGDIPNVQFISNENGWITTVQAMRRLLRCGDGRPCVAVMQLKGIVVVVHHTSGQAHVNVCVRVPQKRVRASGE